jgi:hypothetical protein
MMTKRHKVPLLIALVLSILAVDGAKSYFVARHEVERLKNLRCSRVIFAGVWFVTFRFDGAHPDSVATFTVAPLVPMIIRSQYCK